MKPIKNRILLLAAIILAAGLSFTAHAQKSTGSLNVFGKVRCTGKVPRGLKLSIYPSNVKEDVYTIDKNGNFNVKLSLNTVYYLHFTADMALSKTIKINTAIPEGSRLYSNYEYKFNVRLIGGFEADEAAVKLKNPAATVVFNRNCNGFDYERQKHKKSGNATALSMK